MSTVQHRPYTDAERRTEQPREWQSRLGRRRGDAGCLFAVLVTVGFLLIGWLGCRALDGSLSQLRSRSSRRSRSASTYGASRGRRRGRRAMPRTLRADGPRLPCEITDAIRIAETEDEGSNYAPARGWPRALPVRPVSVRLGGSAPLPCTQLVVSRAPVSRTVLDIQCGAVHFRRPHASRHFPQPTGREGLRRRTATCCGWISRRCASERSAPPAAFNTPQDVFSGALMFSSRSADTGEGGVPEDKDARNRN
jgi:hypothetical protein